MVKQANMTAGLHPSSRARQGGSLPVRHPYSQECITYVKSRLREYPRCTAELAALEHYIRAILEHDCLSVSANTGPGASSVEERFLEACESDPHWRALKLKTDRVSMALGKLSPRFERPIAVVHFVHGFPRSETARRLRIQPHIVRELSAAILFRLIPIILPEEA